MTDCGNAVKKMKLENQVCTLEQAKRLSDLGIEQESLFRNSLVIENEDYSWKLGYWNEYGDGSESYAAFTVAELSMMLPTHINYEDETYFLEIILGSKRWLAEWHTNKKDLSIVSDGELDRPRGVLWNTYKGNKYLVNVLADWVIALLENNVMTAEEVNQRLNA